MNKQIGDPLGGAGSGLQFLGPANQRATSISTRRIIPLGEQSNPRELSVQSCLASMGISLLIDWNILVFVHRHGMTLASIDQMARLLVCKSASVSDALERLESRQLIESSRLSKGVCFYKVAVASDGVLKSCFQHLLGVTSNRRGRLILADMLKAEDAGSRSGPLPETSIT
jgi:hypothetical protein